MILSICDNSDVQEVMSIISLAVKIICIAVPIMLIISLMITIFKAMTNKDGEVFGNLGKVIATKIIAAILVFFIPTFVNLIAKITLTDTDYKACLDIKTLSEITKYRQDEVESLFTRVNETMTVTDYNNLKDTIDQLPSGDRKNAYLDRLSKVKENLDLQYEVDTALKFGSEEDYNRLLPKVNALSEGDFKNSLLEKLNRLKARVDDENSRMVTPPSVNE